MKAALYARVSTQREEQQNSLHNQELIAEEIALKNGLAIEKKYIESVSGRGYKNRKVIQQLIEDARKGEFQVLIVKSVSRLSRDVVQSRRIADQIERLGIRLILPEDNYDSKHSNNKFNFTLMALFAEQESEKLSERIKMGLRASAREGNYTGSTPPYGYRINKKLKKLEIDDEYAPIVKEIFDLYLYDGWGMSKIGNHLMSRKVKPPRAAVGATNAGIRWHQQTVKNILQNPHYTGTLVQQRTCTSNILAESESYRLRTMVDENNQEIKENAHTPIINQRQFADVQSLIQLKSQNRSNGHKSLFAHIAVCADCGIGMHYKSDRCKSGAYICGGYVKHTKRFCTAHTIEESKLIKTILEDVSSMVNKHHTSESLYSLAKKKSSALLASNEKQIVFLDRQYNSLCNDFEYYVSLHKKGIFSDEQLKQKNDEIQTKQSMILEQKVTLEKEKAEKKDMEANVHAFEKIINQFLNLDIHDKDVLKNVLRRLVDKIVVHENQEIEIYYKFRP